MRTTPVSLLLGLALFLVLPARAQDSVTIPRSRLEELERKEAELEKLKGGSTVRRPAVAPASPAVGGQNATLAPSSEAGTPPAHAVPAMTPLHSLPPLQPGEKVSSSELVSHFLADRAGAGNRYHKQPIVVEGRVIRISKHLLRRQYELVLEGPQAGQEVVCTVRAPEQYEAIYTVNSGAELVGTSRGVRTVLAKVGNNTALPGRCKELKGAQVHFAAE